MNKKRHVTLVLFIVGIMLTRLDVQRVMKAFANMEWGYWKENYEEWILLAMHPLILKSLQHPYDRVDPAVLWDGFRWHYVRCLICAQLWSDVKRYIEGMRETFLREKMQTLIHSVSPRLYQELRGDDD